MNSKQDQTGIVLIVDDSAADRALAGELIEREGYETAYANDGQEALSLIEVTPPDVVVTDLRMPELDGLQLVVETRRKFPHVPVVLMTGVGSEDIAAKALRAGAASYVPKRSLAADLPEVLRQVFDTIREPGQVTIGHVFRRQESHFELGYERDQPSTVVSYLQQCLAQLEFADEPELVRIGIALTEALNNAIEHGNLELSSSLRELADGSYDRLRAERKEQSPYRDRTVRVTSRVTPDEAVFIISDDGQGYDPSRLPDPTDPENLMKASGRGMLLIRTFMSEVHFNSLGNEITMIKRS